MSTCNLEIIAHQRMNGYLMLPAEPGLKQTYCRWGSVTKANYNFNELFRGKPINVNAAMLLEDMVSVLDFDKHGPEPNGATLYQRLEQESPEIFQGAIIELTQSGGYHVYYRGIPGSTYRVSLSLDGVEIMVEVLCGRRLCYCYPTFVEGRGRYVILTKNRTFLNTRPGDLPMLPELFKRPPVKIPENAPSPRSWAGDDLLSREDVEAAVSYYVNDCRFNETGRHNQGRALARCLAGLGLDELEITRHVEAYIRRHGRELTDQKEAGRLAAYGLKHPLEGKPWKAIVEARRSRGHNALKEIFEG